MITHTNGSYWIPNETRQSEWWKFKEVADISHFRIFHKTQHATHLLKLVDKNMKWIRLVLWKIQSEHDSVQRWTDGQMEKKKPVYSRPFNFVERITKNAVAAVGELLAPTVFSPGLTRAILGGSQTMLSAPCYPIWTITLSSERTG